MKRSARALLLAAAACAGLQHQPTAVTQDVVFTTYSPLSRTAEVGSRALTPITYERGKAALKTSGKQFAEQQIDLREERFALYVPAGPPPPGGWALLVFISPGPDAVRPMLWRAEFDQRGMIFVSPAHAGNEERVLDRRLPLALLAYENVKARYPIDPQRTYVGGFSGGARVAEITALGYPDVFRGALLQAGSDPIDGQSGMYKPSADLFRQFQQTRLVYVTGEKDEINLLDDQASLESMKANCVFDVDVIVGRRLGHEMLDLGTLGRALDSLDKRSPPDPGELERCNARMRQDLSARFAEVEAALARGDRDGAGGLLKVIDGKYAGLAAPRSVELDRKIWGP